MNYSDMKPVVNESGIEIKQIYGPQDVENSGGTEFVGEPGTFPFTRGIHKEMYRRALDNAAVCWIRKSGRYQQTD